MPRQTRRGQDDHEYTTSPQPSIEHTKQRESVCRKYVVKMILFENSFERLGLRRTGRLLFLEVRKPWGGYKACARFVSPRPLNRTASACGRCIQTLSNPVVVVALAVGVVEAEKRSQCLGFDCIGQASADQEGATNGIHGAE